MLHIAICDDEIPELTNMSGLMEEYRKTKLPDLRYDTFQGGFSLLSAMDSGVRFDIVFLDILMPQMSGMEIAAEIRKMDQHIKIVFLTSSPEYAVESYKVNACNYVLKPVYQEMLFQVMDDVLDRMQSPPERGFVIRDCSGGATKILLSQLMYCEVVSHCVFFYLSGERIVKSQISLGEVLQSLTGLSEFVQPHRSFLVNLHYVQRLTKTQLVLLNGKALPISRNKYAEISGQFMANSFQEAFVGR